MPHKKAKVEKQRSNSSKDQGKIHPSIQEIVREGYQPESYDSFCPPIPCRRSQYDSEEGYSGDKPLVSSSAPQPNKPRKSTESTESV